jgi:hypothetical protein
LRSAACGVWRCFLLPTTSRPTARGRAIEGSLREHVWLLLGDLVV